jgi:hypothetical protein
LKGFETRTPFVAIKVRDNWWLSERSTVEVIRSDWILLHFESGASRDY